MRLVKSPDELFREGVKGAPPDAVLTANSVGLSKHMTEAEYSLCHKAKKQSSNPGPSTCTFAFSEDYKSWVLGIIHYHIGSVFYSPKCIN